jgi:hypothetical protein
VSSTVADIAREEAERAEAGQPDEQEGAQEAQDGDEAQEGQESGEQQEGAQGQPSGPSEAQIEAVWKSLDREGQRHAREVEKRAGAMFAELVPCPACQVEGATPGYIFPVIPEPMQSIRREAVSMALGGQAPVELLDDPDAEACERCGANGMLKTHSNVQGQEKRVCTACNGQGWKPKVNAPPVFAAAAPPLAAPQPFAGVSPNGQVPDQWGRAPGQERYGQHPSIGGW